MSKELAEKFDEVVVAGPAEEDDFISSLARQSSASWAPAHTPAAAAPAAVPARDEMAELRDTLAEVQADLRDGLAAAAQLYADALAPVKAKIDELSKAVRAASGASQPVVALRDDLRALAARLETVPGAEAPSELGALRAELGLLRQDLQRERDQRDALRAAVLGAVGAMSRETLASLRDALADARLDHDRAREAAAGAQREVMRTLEAFHDELAQQWRDRRAVEENGTPELGGGQQPMASAVDALRTDVRELAVYVSMVDSNLRQLSDAIGEERGWSPSGSVAPGASTSVAPS